jgi:SAM-dependent methyltransferase
LPECYRCGVCGGSFIVNPEKDVYTEEYFGEKTNPSVIAKISAPLLDFFYFLRIRKIKGLLKRNSNSKVLDYGCGAGKLVKMLIKKGINAVGFEPSEGARRIACRGNLPVFGEIKSAEGGYDLIMFWHSLEHMETPLEIIKNIKNFLSKDGQLLIAAPNAGGFEARIFKENWFHYSYPFHRIHFTPKSAKIMLRKIGFYPTLIDFWNPEYTISGLIQSFLNWFLPKDVLYSVISHRRQTMLLYKAILISLASVFIILVFSPLLILFFIFQLIFHKTGAMVITAEKI